jgi:hypothetical protein
LGGVGGAGGAGVGGAGGYGRVYRRATGGFTGGIRAGYGRDTSGLRARYGRMAEPGVGNLHRVTGLTALPVARSNFKVNLISGDPISTRGV